MMTDKAKTIFNKIAVLTPKKIVQINAGFHNLTEGVQEATGKYMKALARSKNRPSVRPSYPPAMTVAEARGKTKTAGVVDRTVAELNELQWGYRSMRNPYAEANSIIRFSDYFSKQSAALPGGLAEKKKKKDSDFNPKAIQKGMKVEREHTSKKEIQKEIAQDHLTEDPKYYDKLERMEKGSALLRDVDPRNRAVAKAQERGAVFGSGVGMATSYLLARGSKVRPLAGALGVIPGFLAGKAVAGTAATAYQETKRAPKGSHNFPKK